MGWRRIGVAAVALAFALLPAGCDSDDNETSSGNTPEVQGNSYANVVCLNAVSWSTASTTIDDYSAQKASDQDVVDAVNQAQAQTTQYVQRIRRIPEPDDPTQSAAFDSLQKTAETVTTAADSIQTGIEKLPASADKVQAQIERIYAALKTSVSQLDAIYPDTGVAAAVAGKENCDKLQ
jgi:hypothetical protein